MSAPYKQIVCIDFTAVEYKIHNGGVHETD